MNWNYWQWRLEKFQFYLYGKKVFFNTDHKAVDHRCNKEYSTKQKRWSDHLAQFDIAIQHIAGSNLKFSDYLSQNPVGEQRRKAKLTKKM